MKALNILLINPSWNGLGNRKKIKVSEKRVHPLTLGIIAGIIKKHHENHRVRVVDENILSIPFAEDFDLVALTVNTYTAPRAFAIAKTFREKNIPVLLGGVAPSLDPETALEHADAVVVGEAEEALPRLLDDLIKNQLQRIYKAETLADLSRVPFARRELYGHKKPNAAFVQATRGCNNICRFCYLQYLSWGPFRKRPISEVIAEIAGIKEKIILFVDDNMFVDRDYCLELFSELKKLKKFWWAQAPTTLAYDEKLLSAAADSGCFSVSYGFQTVNEGAISEDQILQNRIENYRKIVENTQKKGILVDGTFIFGFDQDDPGIFKRTVNMIRKMNLDSYTLYLYTVYPGTSYYQDFKQSGRLVSTDSGHFDWDHVVIKPKQMSVTTLNEGVRWAYKKLDRYYYRTMGLRFFRNIPLLFKSPALARFLLSTSVVRKYYNDY